MKRSQLHGFFSNSTNQRKSKSRESKNSKSPNSNSLSEALRKSVEEIKLDDCISSDSCHSESDITVHQDESFAGKNVNSFL